MFLKTANKSRFQKLIQQMFYTMKRAGGVGLASPQINKPLQMFVVEIKKSKIRPEVKPLKKTIVVNPKITSYSKKLANDWEGCLSLPAIRGLVPRYTDIIVEFYNQLGKKQIMKLSGFQARVFQHEIDHLNGILYIDKMNDLKTLMTVDEFKKRILKKSALKSK